MIKKSKSDIIKESLSEVQSRYPDSIIADLLTHFDQDTVLKLMILYNGRTICFPKIDTMWKTFRNKIIVDALSILNNHTNVKQLAHYFGIPEYTIRNIYYSQRNRLPSMKLTSTTVGKIVETIYRKNVEKFNKDMRGLFTDKYGVGYFSVHDITQNPEDLFVLKDGVDKLKSKCILDVQKHPIFTGREYKIDEAVKLVLKKIAENH